MPLRKIIGPYRGLPAGVYVLSLANVLNNLGSFIWPLMSLLLTERLGFSKAAAGLFTTSTIVVSGAASLAGGRLADRLGRKRIFLVTRTLGALFFVPCAFLDASPMVPWLFLINSALMSLSSPALNAMVADLTDRDRRPAAFSLMYLSLNIGFAAGPMIAGLLYNSHLPWLFLGDALTTVLSSILVALTVPETLPSEEHRMTAAGAETAEEGGLIAALLKRPRLLAVSLGLLVLSFVYAQYTFGLPLQASATFAASGSKVYGLLMSLNGLTVILGTVPLTYLTKGLPAGFSLGLGALLYALGFGMIGLLEGSVPMFVLSTLTWSVGEVIITVNSQAYIANNSPVTHRGRFNAAIHTISDTGRALAPAVMGGLADRHGLGLVWAACFFLAAPVALLFFAQASLAGRNKGGSLGVS